MKTRQFLTAILAIFMVAAFAQNQPVTHDIEGAKAPAHPSILLPSLGYVTDLDNENNAFTGTPDEDMDVYMWNYYTNHPIEFNIFINEATVTSAQLSILNWDIDWSSGERDHVFINGNSVGYLTGTNESWSTSVFTVNPAYIVPGPSGKNRVQIYVDEDNPPPNSSWAVTVDWGQLVINNTTGNAKFRYVNLDKPSYCGGECIQVTEEVDADPAENIRVETYLLDPSNNAVVQVNKTYEAQPGDDPFTVELCLPANPTPGTWTVQTIIYDVATNVQQDIKNTTVPVTVSCNTIPTLGEWGLILLAVALLGVGTVYIMRRRNSGVSA